MVNPSQIDLPALARPIKQRIERGSELLFDMEQRGETGPDYQSWLVTYVQLVEDYIILTERMILGGQTSVEAVAPVPAESEQTSLELSEETV